MLAAQETVIYIAQKNKAEIPSESYESGGGRRAHKDGSNGNGQGTSKDNDDRLCEGCQRKFKNSRGVKIHQTKTACLKKNVAKPLSKVDKSEDASTPVNHHSSSGTREGWRKSRRIPSMIFTRRTPKITATSATPVNHKLFDRSFSKVTIADRQAPRRNLVKEIIAEWNSDSEDDSIQQSAVESPGSIVMPSPESTASKPVKRVSLTSKESRSLREWLKASPSSKEKRNESGTSSKAKEKQESEGSTSEGKAQHKSGIHTRERKTFLDKWLKSPQAQSAPNHQEEIQKPQEEKQLESTPKIVQSVSTEQSIKMTELLEMRSKIVQGSKEDIIAKHNITLRKRDLRSLLGNNWLNDSVIDEYLMKIERRSESESSLPSVTALTAHFYKVLDRDGIIEGMRSTRNWIKYDLRMMEVILVPIHKSHHWSLVLIDVQEHTIHYLDSLEGSRNTSQAPGVMKQFMEAYHRERGEDVQYKVKIRRDAPKQTNGTDCGVFVCQYSERLGRRAPLNFHQKDIQNIRWRMIWEIMNGVLSENLRVLHEKKVSKVKVQKTVKVQITQEVKGDKKGKSETHKEGKKTTDRSNLSEEQTITKKARINWPKSNSTEWRKLDTDLSNILSAVRGSAVSRAESHPTIIYNFSLERFGPVKNKKPKQNCVKGPSRRQRECKHLREEINKLKEAYTTAPEEEKEGIAELQNEKLRALRLKKRAESIKSSRGKYKRNAEEFISQPYSYARKVLDPQVKGRLQSSKEEVEEFVTAAHSDPAREEEIPIPDDLYEYPEVELEFNKKPPTLKEFSALLRKTRSKSAPGPNGVPYKVYKKCPGVAKELWSYLRDLWKKNVIPDSWRKAEGVFIPKEDGATVVSKFRTINLCNVEGKLQLGLLAGKITQFTVGNGYIDTSIQKGGVPGIAGCLEHTAILSQLMRDAKKDGKDLVSTWLDIKNAYGSIPHKLISIALKRAHIPEEVQELINSYYSDVSIRFTTEEFTTEFLKLQKGIITGCTLSVILFALTMTMLVLSAHKETKGPTTSSGQLQKTTRLFMDDISTTTETKVQSSHLLNALSEKLSWGRLEVKPEKCRCLVIKKGALSQDTVKIQGQSIMSVKEKPVKYLGKLYNFSLNDREQVETTIDGVRKGLKKINSNKLPGRYKAWIMEHMLLPRTMWPLMIYAFPATKVEKIQQLFTASVKKWLGIPKSLSTDAFYSTSMKLQLPYSSVVEEVKAAKTRILYTYQQSSDECIRNANINVDAGSKWSIRKEIPEAESRLRLQEIAGIANIGREGIGMSHRQYFSKSSGKEKRGLIVQQVRIKEEEIRRARIAGLSKQAASTRWQVPERKLGHREIISTSEASLKFLIKSVYDLLPTPANKCVWFRTEEFKCQLCGGSGTLNHILSACPVALQQGRFRYRHDEVLKEISKHIDEKRKQMNSSPWKKKKKKKIEFLKTGERGKQSNPASTPPESYFDTARDWSMRVDVGRKLVIPVHIMETSLRPDIIIISERSKQLGIIELTVPSEARVEVSHQMKLMKYTPIEETATRRGWKVRSWAVEVGCRGFAASSLSTCLKELGFTGSKRRSIMKSAGLEAERASQKIWSWSYNKQWGSKDSTGS